MPDSQKCMPTAHICPDNQKSLPTIHTHGCLQLLCLVHEIVQTVTTLHYFLNVLCHDALNLINLRLKSGHRVIACFGEVFLSRKIKIILQITHNSGTYPPPPPPPNCLVARNNRKHSKCSEDSYSNDTYKKETQLYLFSFQTHLSP